MHCENVYALQWRNNGHNGVSNHQPHNCLLNRLFRHRSKKTSKLRVTGFVRGIHRRRANSPHKGPVTRKNFPFDDVIMERHFVKWGLSPNSHHWNYHSGTLSIGQVPATHLKLGNAGARYSNEMQWRDIMIGYQDRCSCIGHPWHVLLPVMTSP